MRADFSEFHSNDGGPLSGFSSRSIRLVRFVKKRPTRSSQLDIPRWLDSLTFHSKWYSEGLASSSLVAEATWPFLLWNGLLNGQVLRVKLHLQSFWKEFFTNFVRTIKRNRGGFHSDYSSHPSQLVHRNFSSFSRMIAWQKKKRAELTSTCSRRRHDSRGCRRHRRGGNDALFVRRIHSHFSVLFPIAGSELTTVY